MTFYLRLVEPYPAWPTRLGIERAGARTLWPRLQSLRPRTVLARLEGPGAVPWWGLATRFLAQSRRHLALHPEKSLRWAEVSLALARQTPPERYPHVHLPDLRGAALCAIAEAQRLLGQPLAAGAGLDLAARELQATTDPRLVLELLRLDGVIALDLGDFVEAERRLRLALLEAGADFVPPRTRLWLAYHHATAAARLDPDTARERIAGLLEQMRGEHERGLPFVPPLLLELLELDLDHGDLAAADATFERLAAFPTQGEAQDFTLAWLKERIELQRSFQLADEEFLALRAQRNLRSRFQGLSYFFSSLTRARDSVLASLDALAVAVRSNHRTDLEAALDDLARSAQLSELHAEAQCALRALRERLLDPNASRLTSLPLIRKARIYLESHWWTPQRWISRGPTTTVHTGGPLYRLAITPSRAAIDSATFFGEFPPRTASTADSREVTDASPSP